MDKSWMTIGRRCSPEYRARVDSFIEFAKASANTNGWIYCPCVECMNVEEHSIKLVRYHLWKNGINISYKTWTKHGESLSSDQTVLTDNSEQYGDKRNEMGDNEVDEQDELPHLLEDLYTSTFPSFDSSKMPNACEDDGFQSFLKFLDDSQRDLYPGCKSFTVLSFVLKMFHMKALYQWSDRSFNELMNVLQQLLPKCDEKVPWTIYETKKFLSVLGLGYKPIHACKYDCVLFWKENANLDKCPVCEESRYRLDDGNGRKIPHKVLRYFPLIPRLKRLYESRKTATDMRWHKEKRVDDGVLRHPADGEEWKNFDRHYPSFAMETRNVRLGLATDGFNPFGNMSNAYSVWPVIVTPYNLPPWMCMKESFCFMSLLIPGPLAPGRDIDVYLQPLIDELKELWEIGVQTHDASTETTFQMRVAVMWTINDFPAYGNLSRWSTKGYLACLACNKDCSSQRLVDKIGYMGARRYLPENHPWRKSKLFNGHPELRSKPIECSGERVLEQLSTGKYKPFGKHPTNKKSKNDEINVLNWKKKSIFWELPYWRTLNIRHNLDVMHIEKNICDSILGTLLSIDGKNKDTDKARLDLENMKIRKNLHLKMRDNGTSYLKPVAPFSLIKKERDGFYAYLKSIKYPDGYAANISRCISANGDKILGLKSHDCHILLQRILPIGMRGFLSDDICTTLLELGDYFQQLCSKSLKLGDLKKMEDRIVLILCKLEKIFPPAFFDVMIHLAIHLPYEALLGGPVQYRWMYPIERLLGVFKGFVGNRARPEGSIAERYMAKECTTFCSMYLNGIETIFNREERNSNVVEHIYGLEAFNQTIRPIGEIRRGPDAFQTEIDMAHWFVLFNSFEIGQYLEEHRLVLQSKNLTNIEKRQRAEFPGWFKQRINLLRSNGSPEVNDDIWSLANGPRTLVHLYSGCIANGVRFLTRDRDNRLRSQNCGVMVIGDHKGVVHNFYGYLTKVWELQYVLGRKIYLFQCEWYNSGNNRTCKSDVHLTTIDTTSRWYRDDPFVFPSQVQQVFYVNDTKLGANWKVVQQLRRRGIWDVPESEGTNPENVGMHGVDAFQQDENDEFSPIIVEDLIQDENYLSRTDVDAEIISGDVVSQSKKRAYCCDNGDELMDQSEDDETGEEYDTDLDDGLNEEKDYDYDLDS